MGGADLGLLCSTFSGIPGEILRKYKSGTSLGLLICPKMLKQNHKTFCFPLEPPNAEKKKKL